MTVAYREVSRTLRSGVVVALPRAAERPQVYAACAAFAPQADRFSEAEGRAIAVFGFDAPHGETALAVWHVGADACDARPDIARVLGTPVADAIRVESYVTPDAPEAAVRAEVLLLRVAQAIANLYGGRICDDIGAIYDPAEIDRLVAAGKPRETSFTFAVAAAARVDEIDVAPAVPIEFARLDPGGAPSECAPDVALAAASIFVVMGPHVPLITAARIAYVAGNGPAIPIVVFGPNLRAADIAVLAAAGISVERTVDELEAMLADEPPDGLRHLIAPARLGRDEIALFLAEPVTLESARGFFSERSLQIANLAASGANDQPAIVVLDAPTRRNLPSRLARFAFAGAVLDVYDVDLANVHPLIGALLAARREIASTVGTPAAHALVCELLVERDVALETAGAFAVSLLGEFAIGTDGVAQDDAGELYDVRALARLAIARRSRRMT